MKSPAGRVRSPHSRLRVPAPAPARPGVQRCGRRARGDRHDWESEVARLLQAVEGRCAAACARRCSGRASGPARWQPHEGPPQGRAVAVGAGRDQQRSASSVAAPGSRVEGVVDARHQRPLLGQDPATAAAALAEQVEHEPDQLVGEIAEPRRGAVGQRVADGAFDRSMAAQAGASPLPCSCSRSTSGPQPPGRSSPEAIGSAWLSRTQNSAQCGSASESASASTTAARMARGRSRWASKACPMRRTPKSSPAAAASWSAWDAPCRTCRTLCERRRPRPRLLDVRNAAPCERPRRRPPHGPARAGGSALASVAGGGGSTSGQRYERAAMILECY